MPRNHSSYVDGHLEPTIVIDLDSIDRGSPLTAELEGATERNRELSLVEQFSRAIAEIYNSHNSKKSALCLMIATGSHAAQGRTIVSAAREFGVSKQDISKCCVAWCDFMGIPPSDYMRCQASKVVFRKSNITKKKA